MFRFFQDKLVKVSLFLQSGSQSSEGTLVLRQSGLVATGAEIPGTFT